jgi:hypothetical protein
MQRSTQSRILMELALVRIANLDHFHQIAVLLEQLRSNTTSPPLPTTIKPVQKIIAPPQPSGVEKASRVEKTGLGTLNETQIRSVWFKAAESIPGMLGSAAMKCTSIRLEKPNRLIAIFDNKTSKELCEQESARLQGVLSQSVGEAVKIRLELNEPAEPASVERTSSPQTDREQYLAATENPLVLKIQETFGVTLQDVRK